MLPGHGSVYVNAVCTLYTGGADTESVADVEWLRGEKTRFSWEKNEDKNKEQIPRGNARFAANKNMQKMRTFATYALNLHNLGKDI